MKTQIKFTALLAAAMAMLLFGVQRRADATLLKIYWTDNAVLHAVKRADPDGTNQETLAADSGRGFLGIDIDASGEKVYWINRTTNTVSRTDLDGTTDELSFISIDSINPSGIGVAGGSVQRVYFDDGFDANMAYANLDGTGRTDLDGLGLARQIAFDLASGKMYWADLTNSRIARADLDGTSIETLIDTSDITGFSPRGIALDVAGGKMYFSDKGPTDAVLRADLAGTNIETVVGVGDGLGGPENLALDLTNRKVYIADFVDSTIVRADMDDVDGINDGFLDVITTGVTSPFGVALLMTNVVPEPSTLALATLCIFSLGMTRRRRRR